MTRAEIAEAEAAMLSSVRFSDASVLMETYTDFGDAPCVHASVGTATRKAPANCWAADCGQARHECSVRELVDIHKRELMTSLMESAQKRAESDSFYDCPRDTARAAWQYEHIRGFSIELSELAVALKDACTVETCPQMKATDEWMYLCAAHKQPQECCAIDYIVHTLDGTAALLNSNKWFPRRGGAVPEASFKYFQSITRRLYRILSHCYFHHRDVFDVVEQQRHLCFRFVRFAQVSAL
jgi:hypothetical protein